MATPIWTFQYAMNQTPEAQGFTRFIHQPAPLINLVVGGSPSNRRIEVNTSDGGDVSFLTSNVPAFNPALGMTAEGLLSVSGPGAAGFEVRFLPFALSMTIYQDYVTLEQPWVSVTTPSNASDILWRTTYDGSLVRIYRAGSLVIGPVAPIANPGAFQQFQFWAEGGGLVVYKQMKYFIAGAVPP